MSSRFWGRSALWALVGALLVAASSGSAVAGITTLTIDSTQSVLEMTGVADLTSLGLGTLPLGPQGPFTGSGAPVVPGFSDGTRAQYNGTIEVDIDLIPQTLTFTGNSNMDAEVSGIWGPQAGGGPPGQTIATLSTGPADYGLSLGGLVWAAVRNFRLNTSSAALNYDGSGNYFPDLSMALLSGNLDTTDTLGGAFLSPGTTDLGPGDIGLVLNQIGADAGPGSLAISGNSVTLTIPISVVQQIDVGVPVDLIFAGRIVATGTYVPEPSSIALAAMGLVGLVGMAWRRRRA